MDGNGLPYGVTVYFGSAALTLESRQVLSQGLD
jgi:hypothetical protein